MRDAWETFREFRKSRPGSLLASVMFVLFGVYGVFIEASLVNFVLGVLFFAVGLAGLYSQLLGEPVTKTLRKRL